MRSLLRPGLYCLRSEVLWARPGARLPVHLRRTKVERPSGGALVPWTYRILRLVAGAFFVLPSRSNGTAELVVASYDGGAVVLDQVRGKVHRSYGTGRLTSDEVRRRQVFSRHVSAPQFWLLDGGAAVEEELVEGAHLDDLSNEGRSEVVSMLAEQFAELTSAYVGDPASVTDRDLESLMQDINVPPDLARAWDGSSTAWLSPTTPWIPSPREANAKNLMVRPDGRPAPIDLGDLQIDPFFVYPVGILIAGGEEIVRRFLAGADDYSLQSLFKAADQRWAGTLSERRGLLLSRILYAAYKDGWVDRGEDLGAFEESLQRRWEEVRSLFVEAEGRLGP